MRIARRASARRSFLARIMQSPAASVSPASSLLSPNSRESREGRPFSPPSASSPSAADAKAAYDNTLVQYVVVRKDLKWHVGSLIAQACHATAAVLWKYRDDPETIEYLAAADQMHKVVLAADSEEALQQLAVKLAAAGIAHKLWIEQPEIVMTCIATKPAPRKVLRDHFVAFKLLR